MKIQSPIYNLFHQEIKACVEHLLEMSQRPDPLKEQDGEQICGRLNELHQFSLKVRSEEHYYPLRELKDYLENTMLGYQDDRKQLQTIRLSEAISLLTTPPEPPIKFLPSMVRSLTRHLIRHVLEEAKPGRPLFRKLNDIKRVL